MKKSSNCKFETSFIFKDQQENSAGRPNFPQPAQVRTFDESVLIEAKCTADPLPSFTWTLDGKPITPSNKYKQG